MITVQREDGTEVRCKVVENIGYQGGHHARIVLLDGKERHVVKAGKVWRLWTARDRVQPLTEHIERLARQGKSWP